MSREVTVTLLQKKDSANLAESFGITGAPGRMVILRNKMTLMTLIFLSSFTEFETSGASGAPGRIVI